MATPGRAAMAGDIVSGVRHPQLPDSRDRLRAAELTGECERIGVGSRRHLSDGEALALLTEISTDPVVLGHVLGSYLIRAEDHPVFERIVGLLRQAGADENTAARVAEWHRWKRDQTNPSGIIL